MYKYFTANHCGKTLVDLFSKSIVIRLFSMLIIISMHVSVFAYAQKITIKKQNASLSTVIKEIKKQSGYNFLYDAGALLGAPRINVDVKQAAVSEVLDRCFEGLPLRYVIRDNNVIISRKALSVPGGELIQQHEISGRVTNNRGEPLEGVTVTVKGTIVAVTTDSEGIYHIVIPQGGTALVFSSVGYVLWESPIGTSNTVNAVLNESISDLEEVVVVGYGVQQKKDLTGSVATVRGDAITTRKTTQISSALQGAVPGVMVTRGSNAPGAAAQIRVRGITTITEGGQNPLIILDDVPIDDINSINPNDVESITVLKDAASASIYGSRAAAGVILVTTKRAQSGRVSLDYNAEYGLEVPTRIAEYVDAVRYMQLTNELRWNDNNNPTDEYPIYTQDIIDNYSQLNAENPDLFPITDWTSLVLRNSAPRTSHILGISGSGQYIRTRASFGYDRTEALYEGRDYQRITARVNNDLTINSFLSASVDLNFRRTIIKQPTLDPLYKIGITAPIYAALWSDGRIGAGKDGDNVYAMVKHGGFNNAWYNQLGGKISLDLTPIEGLKVSAVLSPFFNFDKSKVFRKAIPYTAWDNPDLQVGYMFNYAQTNLTESRPDNYRYTTQFLANYDRTFGDHNLGLMAGYEYFYAFNEYLGASRDQYLLSSYPYLDLGPLEFRNNNGGAYENAYRSWFGRVMYNYKSKYLLQANIRYDASSRFAPGYRWGSFPSFSAGWAISEESFLKESADWLSYLKFRASWGSLGNERIGNYPYQSILSFENNSLFYQGNNVVSAQSAAQWQYAIRDISWETTQSFDIGLDANFFSNRLTTVFDYYKKTTHDMLLELQIPQFIGFDNPDQNTGRMYTTGWEAQIGWNDRIGDFAYSASFNISDFRSRMGDLGGTEFLGDQIKIEGSEFNEWFGYVSDGLFQTQEDLDNSPKLNANVRLGDVKLRDISGPDGVPDGRISPEHDRVLLGGSLPRLMYGADFNFNYKNWSLGIVLQGVGKQNSRLTTHMVTPLLENWGNFPAILDGNSWSHYSTAEQNLNARYPRYTSTSYANNYSMSDFWLINGAYFRVKNINLGYNIPTRHLQKVGVQNLRLYGTVTDLLSVHNFPKGWDPETSWFGYPITTSYVFGASVNF